VVAINERLEAEPELINDDPWEKGWMVMIEPTNLAVEEPALMDAAAYRNHVEASDH
jgi:glycine cleavage system H protein